MAYVLSLPSSNPLDRPFVEPVCISSRASMISQISNGTIRHGRQRSQTVQWPLSDEHRLASQTVLNYMRASESDLTPRHSPVPSKTSFFHELAMEKQNETQQDVAQSDAEDIQRLKDSVVPFPPLEQTAHHPSEEQIDHVTLSISSNTPQHDLDDSLPFKRWLSTLRKRHDHNSPRRTSQGLDQPQSPRSRHQKSLSISSSMGMLTGVRSTTLTMAGTSIAPNSRYGRQSQFQSDNTSCRGPRVSMDSGSPSVEPGIDGKAWYRSVQRRNIVEEILQSEESYISDMKVMIHVYFTLLASTSSVSPRKKDSIGKSISQIIYLHEDLLTELQTVVPSRAEMAHQLTPQRQRRRTKHTRWHSADNGHAAPRLIGLGLHRRQFQHSVDMTRSSSPISRSMIVTTNTVLNVAKVFDRFMKRFLAYEAYVAYHEIVHEEAHSTSRMVPAWPTYERGVEALSAHVNTVEQRELGGRKGMTLSDLGIKPIQRICKYPLFFADLCRHTPACDDPIVHAELEKVLSRLQETAEEIDYAMDNPQTRSLIETTWILQDRLVFRNQEYSALAPTQTACIRSLGRVVLCGVLHTAYDTADRVKGRYTICILYRNYLVLASVGTNCGIYLIDAIIPLLGASIEVADDGRGLQCHTASHTWKLFFLYQHKHYEILFSACSEVEEDAWKCNIRLRIAAEARDAAEGRHMCSDVVAHLAIDIKSVGSAFTVNIDLVRRLSMRRAATLGPKSSLRQVIIKNTHAQTPGQHGNEDSVQVSRSKSHMSSSHMPTLAPRRTERIRLENILVDVWSRDSIPYPGMATRRPENTIRASANSVMRKLSMASIASNFSSKRTASFSGHVNQRPEIGRTPSPRTLYNPAARSRRREKSRSRAAVVDFHTAPNAFLPEDFELKKPTLTMRGQNFMRRAMTMDGNRTPPQVPLPSRDHKRSASMSATTGLSAPKSTPNASEDSGYVDGRRVATALHMRLSENSSPQLPAVETTKPPVKVKRRLFKLLGVNGNQD